MELVERRFDTVAQAVAALKRGDVQVVDRLNPWTLPSLRADPHLVVQSYAMPLVHCLIPNVRRPLLGDRTFRRALAYGIQRAGDPPADARRGGRPRLRGHQQSVPLGDWDRRPDGLRLRREHRAAPLRPAALHRAGQRGVQNYLDAQAAQKAGQKPDEKKEQKADEKTEQKPDEKKTEAEKKAKKQDPPCRS